MSLLFPVLVVGSETCPFGQFCTMSGGDASPLLARAGLATARCLQANGSAGENALASDPDRMVK
jgi:hypothetical protein